MEETTQTLTYHTPGYCVIQTPSNLKKLMTLVFLMVVVALVLLANAHTPNYNLGLKSIGVDGVSPSQSLLSLLVICSTRAAYVSVSVRA